MTEQVVAALNPYIGYAKGAEIAKEARRTGKTVVEVARERKLLDEKLLAQILDPRRMTEPAPPLEETRQPKAETAGKKPAAAKKPQRKKKLPKTRRR
jgi:hypothetical protein